MPDSHLAQPELSQEVFRPADTDERFGLNPRVVGKARGQAGQRRLVPGGELEKPGELPDLRLGQPGFPQRRADTEFFSRFRARPEVSPVIEIRAVEYVGDRIGRGDFLQPGEELLLAVVAAQRRILGESGVPQFLRLDDPVPDAEPPGQCSGRTDFPLRIGLGPGDDRQDVFPQRLRGHLEEQGAVHPPGKGDQDLPHTAEAAAEIFQLGQGGPGRALIISHGFYRCLACFSRPPAGGLRRRTRE